MHKKLPWAELIMTTLALLIGAGVYLYAHKDEGELEESKRIGAAIVQALESYRAERGAYPDQLDALVPRHIARIDPPTWGLRRWRYRTYTPVAVGGAPDSAGSTGAEVSAPDPPADPATTGIDSAVVGPPAGTKRTGSDSAGAGPRADTGTTGIDSAASAPAPARDELYYQLSVAASTSGYPVLYYDVTARRWVLNN